MTNFKFTASTVGSKVTLAGMLVGAITPSEDKSYYKIALSVCDEKIFWKWTVLKKTFKKEADAKKFLTAQIDNLLSHFALYPIALP